MTERRNPKTRRPEGDPLAMIRGDSYRFTFISKRILRMEFDPEGVFEDRETQLVVNRVIENPAREVYETQCKLVVQTEKYTLYFHKGPFTPSSLWIDVHNRYTNYGGTWRYGQTLYGDPPRHENLYGTARTLDKADGAVPLDFGLMSFGGYSVLADTTGTVDGPKGRIGERRAGTVDLYFIACEHDYQDTLREYYMLTGAPPMLPRYALGNWWCRYRAYSDREYLALMDRFEEKGVPLSVAVLDMDWHVTDVPAICGRGWTGYTWNRELFPEPEAFLKELHRKCLHCILNLHPAAGIQSCEDVYPAMARRMGIDPQSGIPIDFDCTDETFMDAYLTEVIHPLEALGVDAWWIDWQQGRLSPRPGVDPLWQLNRMLYEDHLGRSERSVILSRYAGPGSHRYPVGFSGDTIATWASLRFQPYFTATAANIGFIWWSHDIGGFKAGVYDRELFLRWLQFGVFSPILRLHCSNNPFCSKEPWNYDAETEQRVITLLRLRSRLVPYLYTLSWLQETRLRPSLVPVYWMYPEREEAYKVPNQYFLGDQLMVCPITERTDPGTHYASVRVWIPEGVWTDVQTGKVYHGPKMEVLSRPIDRLAVLAKPGALVPLAHDPMEQAEAPSEMDLYVFPGADGKFTLFEDPQGRTRETEICWTWSSRACLTLEERGNATSAEDRIWYIHFRGMSGRLRPDRDSICAVDEAKRTLSVTVRIPAGERLCLTLEEPEAALGQEPGAAAFDFLHQAEVEYELKSQIWREFVPGRGRDDLLADIDAMRLPESLGNVLREMVMD